MEAMFDFVCKSLLYSYLLVTEGLEYTDLYQVVYVSASDLPKDNYSALINDAKLFNRSRTELCWK
jgi:hypothetical protein